MTPPNELEQLAQFQDAIQSNKGLERLRAMQYLQQMNNQGIMGLPQVQQQPIVQRENGGVTMPEPYYDLDTALKNTKVGEYFVLGQGVDQKLYKVGVGTNGEKIYNEELVTDELKEKLFNVENSPDYTTAPTYIGETTTLVGGIDAYTAEDIKDGTVSEEEAIAYNNRLRNLEQSNQDRPQYDRRQSAEQYGDMGGIQGLQPRAYGGPVIHKGFGGGAFADAIAQATAAGAFKQPTGELVGTPQTVGMKVPFMGGSGVAYPDPSVSQEEALVNLRNMQGPMGTNVGEGIASMFEQGLMNVPTKGSQRLANEVNYQEEVDPMGSPQAMNDEIVNTQGENIPFNFGAARFLSNAGGPVPLRENTQEGIRDRATLGGRIDTGNFVGNLQPNPRYQGGIGSKIKDTWGSNEPPQPVNLPIQSQDVTNAFINDATPDGSLGPTNPRMVEYTPPFYGGGMMPQPMMVPADRDGNPIMPFSKKPMTASNGGYVQNLAGGGIVQGRELQQLQEGGLVDLPVVKMGFGGFLKSIFSAPAQIIKSVVSGAKNIVKSKTFKALAPLVLAVAAPYALGAMFPATFGAGAGLLSTSGALGYGVATGLGSMVGNLLGGAKFSDAAKQGLLSGATGGIFKGIGSGNWMGPGTGGNVASGLSKVKQINTPKTLLEAGTATNVAAAPITGGNPFANQMAIRSAPIGENILTNVNAVPPNVGMSPDAYTGSGLQANQMMATTPGAVETVVPNQFSNVQFAPNVDVGVPPAPDATRTGFFNQGPLSNTGGSPAPGTGSTWDQVKQVGQDIYKDYGNWQGAAKLVGMDMMQPDWDAVYASEASMEDQLRNMDYTIETGFDGQKVIRDSSGTIMPSSLSIQDILDRALGRTPRTRLADKIGFEPNATAFSAQGGLVSLAGGGEFSGMVEGDGHGMEDNVYMPIKERGHGKQIGTLAVSPSEYVVDAHTMSALGNGNPDAGAKVMDNVIAGVRKKAYGTTQQPNEINGLNALMPMMQGV